MKAKFFRYIIVKQRREIGQQILTKHLIVGSRLIYLAVGSGGWQ